MLDVFADLVLVDDFRGDVMGFGGTVASGKNRGKTINCLFIAHGCVSSDARNRSTRTDSWLR